MVKSGRENERKKTCVVRGKREKKKDERTRPCHPMNNAQPDFSFSATNRTKERLDLLQSCGALGAPTSVRPRFNASQSRGEE